MPTPYIKKLSKQGKGTIQELETKWKKAKAIAEEKGHGGNWKYVTTVFNRLVGAAIRNPTPVTYLYWMCNGRSYDWLKSPATDHDKIREIIGSPDFILLYQSHPYDPKSLLGQTVIDLQYIWGDQVFVSFTLTCYDDMRGGSDEPSEFNTTEEQMQFRRKR